MSFEIFAQQIYARFNALSKHELFVVGNDNRTPEQVYIAADYPGWPLNFQVFESFSRKAGLSKRCARCLKDLPQAHSQNL